MLLKSHNKLPKCLSVNPEQPLFAMPAKLPRVPQTPAGSLDHPNPGTKQFSEDRDCAVSALQPNCRPAPEITFQLVFQRDC